VTSCVFDVNEGINHVQLGRVGCRLRKLVVSGDCLVVRWLLTVLGSGLCKGRLFLRVFHSRLCTPRSLCYHKCERQYQSYPSTWYRFMPVNKLWMRKTQKDASVTSWYYAKLPFTCLLISTCPILCIHFFIPTKYCDRTFSTKNMYITHVLHNTQRCQVLQKRVEDILHS